LEEDNPVRSAPFGELEVVNHMLQYRLSGGRVGGKLGWSRQDLGSELGCDDGNLFVFGGDDDPVEES
jgi:hypothetical protein